MELKVGESYRTRTGHKAIVVYRRSPMVFPWLGVVQYAQNIESIQTWTEEGLSYPDKDLDSDLIAPWEEPKPPTWRPWNLEEVQANAFYRKKGTSVARRLHGFDKLDSHPVWWLTEQLTIKALLDGFEWTPTDPLGDDWRPCGVPEVAK